MICKYRSLKHKRKAWTCETCSLSLSAYFTGSTAIRPPKLRLRSSTTEIFDGEQGTFRDVPISCNGIRVQRSMA